MMINNMSEAAMLRDIIRDKDDEIDSLKAKIAELEDKHWNECWQIAHYQNEAEYKGIIISFMLESIDSFRSDKVTLVDGYIEYEKDCLAKKGGESDA